ncbi:MAG: NADH-quinone oxidoreductase subunit J [Deltaproteobacteria bacterium]|nr:NADH-quinone oxidoreductase subunit J [Deltaproteobacteria bacterium]
MEQLFFYIFAAAAAVSALLVITSRSAVHSALFLIVCLLQVAALFVLLRAPFLAAVQVFIYVGAVMVLFLFAVMVLDMGRERFEGHIHTQAVPALAAVVVLFLILGYRAFNGRLALLSGEFTEAVLSKNTEVIGTHLFTKYIFPFEVVSMVFLVALVGAIALVLKDRDKGRG